VAAALLLLTVGGCGSGTTGGDPPADAARVESTKAAEKPANTAAVGKALTVKVQSGATAEVTVLKVTTAKKGKGEFAEKPANGQFLVVDVRIKVTGERFSVNPLYVKYQAADEKVFDSGEGNGFAAGYEPALPAGEVPEGQMSRGFVVFDVPVGAGKQIQLTDELGGPIAFWTL